MTDLNKNMLLFKKVVDLQRQIVHLCEMGHSIGFTPTMGALHDGHLSLVEKSLKETNFNVVSIFVNPTQFNDRSDLEKYPRTTAKDIELLTSAGNSILFLPDVNQIYPEDLNTEMNLDFGQLDKVLEGAFRPGHFEGMAQVVNRLLDIVKPDKLFMGQKDFQQLTIVREMLRQLDSNIELVMCPIIREDSGLARSSRNVRLSPNLRTEAAIINKTLTQTKAQAKDKTPKELIEQAINQLTRPDFKPEYFNIVDGYSLQDINSFDDTSFAVACTAVWVEDVRLIDNVIIKNDK